MQKHKILLPENVEVPDKIPYYVYQNEFLIDEGMTSVASIENTTIGQALHLYADYDQRITMPGTYDIVITATIGANSYSTNATYTISDEPERDIDIIVMDRKIELEDDCNYTLYKDNEKLCEGTYNLCIPKSIEPSLDPLYLMSMDGATYTDKRVFFVTPSIMSAVKDMRSYLDRLNRQLRLDSLEHTDADYLLWLKAGMDRLNLLLTTTFTMTLATGAIRDLWLVASQIQCLRTRYLEEGLTSFNYSGSAVQLDVDVTQYLDTLISQLETRLDNDATKLRLTLHNRGLTSGSGKYVQQSAFAGALGVSRGPASSPIFRR